jgi:hypothetical protein
MKGIDIKADKNRTLRYSINAMIQFKRDKKVNITTALQGFASEVDFELLRYIFWLGLVWEDKELTEDSAGEVMDAAIEEKQSVMSHKIIRKKTKSAINV